jgi:hypothetical protein
MPLLILAIVLFLGFFVIVVWLRVASNRESQEICRHSIHTTQTLTRPLALLSITEAFDPVHAILWEAPIAALQVIDSAGSAGLPVARLHRIFVRAAACFPEVYEGCSFLQWVQFLEQNRLISWQGPSVVLTHEAREFLKYRFTSDALVET